MIAWPPIQTRLGVAADGSAGPVTYAALFNKIAGHPLGERGAALGVGAHAFFSLYRIDSPLRLAHFLGQTAHESELYWYLRELWGPTPAQIRYEGRLDLGNTQAGDGHLFLGRGILQITGRANYRACGQRISVDLEGNPQLAERPDIAVQTACDFWAAHELNALADADDVNGLTRKINGGLNGLSDRIALTEIAKGILA